MTTTTPAPVLPAEQAQPKKPGRARTVFASIALVVAFVLTPFGTLSYSAHETVVNQARYLETMGPIVADPEVQSVIAHAATDAIVEKVDLTEVVQSTLGGLLANAPDRITDMLVGPLANGLQNLIYEAVLRAVSSPQFESAWIATNTAAQQSLIALLEGRNEGIIQTQGEAIVVDVNTLINDVRTELSKREGFAFLDRLPPVTSTRQVTVAVVPGLETAQTIFGFANPAFGFFPLILVLIYGASILLARRRPRMTIIVGSTVVAAAIVTNIAAHQVWDRFAHGLDSTPFEAAAGVFWNAYSNALLRGIPILFLIGFLVVAGGIVWTVLQGRRARQLPAEETIIVVSTD